MMVILAVVTFVFAPSLLFGQPRAERTEKARNVAQNAAAAQSTQVPESIEDIQYSFREIAKRVIPEVVELDVTEIVKQPVARMQSPFDYFFSTPNGNGQTREVPQSGLGSGIIVKKAGDKYYVLTNNHVAGTATTITVRLSDQREYKGTLVGKDARRDIALVAFDSRENLPVADLGDSDRLDVGDLVLAVGNPFGFASSITMGIVSALGRQSPSNQTTFTDYIQTDAAINQGNSGGALVNIKGQVIGMNTWIAAPTGGNVGLGFAIPINNAKQAIDQFINKGEVEYGWLGVSLWDESIVELPGVTKDLKLENVKGALVINVFKGSPADRAGILLGDMIVAVNGQEVKNVSQVTMAVGGQPAGKSVEFEVIRYGERKTIQAKLAARDSKDEVAASKNMWPGLYVMRITDEYRKDNEVPDGVEGVVIAAALDESPASVAGLKAYDMIKQINGKDVKSVMDYYKAINEKGKTTFQILRVDRNGKGTEVTIGLSK